MPTEDPHRPGADRTTEKFTMIDLLTHTYGPPCRVIKRVNSVSCNQPISPRLVARSLFSFPLSLPGTDHDSFVSPSTTRRND